MSDIKESQQRFVEEIQNQGRIEVVDELIAEDMVDHTPFPGLPADREGARQTFEAIRAAFPDHDAEVVHMVADGDLVATYKIFTGTHEGNFMGVPPTGREVTIRVMDFVRYRDGRIVEHWNIVDQAGLLRQLGVA
jgi:steroid delta-isomerase-like uncharacterized protein